MPLTTFAALVKRTAVHGVAFSVAFLACVSAAAPGALSAQQVALTFDDLPRHGALPPGGSHVETTESIARILNEHGAPPTYGFINAAKIEGDPSLMEALKRWRAAGHPLGNHAFSHMNLHENSVEAFEQDVLGNEPALRELMAGEEWHWFRYPYLREGDTVEKQRGAAAMLRKHGYRNAQVTLDYEDYAWNAPYARCSAQGDQTALAWLENSYLATAEEFIDLGVELARIHFGRTIKHTMLLHTGAFNVRMVPRLLELLERKGFTLITLEEAQADPAYQNNPELATKAGITLLERLTLAKGMKFPPHEPKPFEKLDKLCR